MHGKLYAESLSHRIAINTTRVHCIAEVLEPFIYEQEDTDRAEKVNQSSSSGSSVCAWHCRNHSLQHLEQALAVHVFQTGVNSKILHTRNRTNV